MADDDNPSGPGTQAFKPDFSDDDDDPGTQSWTPDFSDSDEDTGARPDAAHDEPETAEPPAGADDAAAESAAAPVQPVTVPGRYLYLRWWKLLLVALGVWSVAAVVGLGLFSWWYHSADATPALYVVLVYVVACAVAGVLLAMVEGRPLVSALSLAVMSAPFASLAASAPLLGYYHCARVGHCLVGLIPY